MRTSGEDHRQGELQGAIEPNRSSMMTGALGNIRLEGMMLEARLN